MCLNINHELTDKRLKDNVDKWRVYKHFTLRDNKLYPQHYVRDTPIQLTSIGFYVSDRTSKHIIPYEDDYNVVLCGIHVYTTQRSNIMWSRVFSLPCWGYKKDLVAFGEHEDAAFMKIQFIKEEVLEALMQMRFIKKEVLEALKDYLFPENIPFPEK